MQDVPSSFIIRPIWHVQDRTGSSLQGSYDGQGHGEHDTSPGAVLAVTQCKLRTVVLLTRVRTVGMVP